MYKKIYVPVDNSAHSNRAIESAVRLGKVFEAELVGSHIYAARMHDYRFKQMEYSLPEEYLEENELERQRKIHDSLITIGAQADLGQLPGGHGQDLRAREAALRSSHDRRPAPRRDSSRSSAVGL